MEVKEFIEKYLKVAVIELPIVGDEYEAYVMDNCQIDIKDSKSKWIKFLADNDITKIESTFKLDSHCGKNEYPQANIGYSEKKNKWFGWSHRAICSFGIGSKVKKGDCAYRATDKEDYENDVLEFWKEDYRENIHIENRTNTSFTLNWIYSKDTPNKKLRGKEGVEYFTYPIKFGKGEWTAETIEDAKEMAMDFARSVS